MTTVQVQDLADMDGDAACGGRTMPLVFGERVARWLTAVLIVAWPFVCPGIWRVDVLSYLAPGTVGGLLAVRVVYCRKVAADRQSWKLWCWWMMVLFTLPAHNVLMGWSIAGR